MKNVDIANSVTRLRWGSFRDTGIETINIPDSVEGIEGYSFNNNSLTAIYFSPNSKLKFMGIGVYDVSNNLSQFVMPESVSQHYGNNPYSNNALKNGQMYCSKKQIEDSVCDASVMAYERDGNFLLVYDKDNNITGIYSDYEGIIQDNTVAGYTKKNKDGLITTVYDGRGNVSERYSYDGAGNLTAAYENGVATYKRTSYTPAEAAKAVKKGNANKVTLTFK